MIMKSSTLRPGLLVSLKTTVVGNVKYDRRVIEPEHVVDDGAQKARWETERTIVDPVEHEVAKVARGKARTLITSVCASSAFGLLCPEANADILEQAIAEARKVTEAFNKQANLTRVNVFVLTGRIAPDDVEAVKAISSEVRDLLSSMEEGVKNLDVKAIRDAASKARQIGTMLSPEAQGRIQVAIDAARSTAKQIVKAGEQAAIEVDKLCMQKIAEQRTMFLDMDEVAAEVAAPEVSAPGIDMTPAIETKAAGEAAPALEM